MIGEIFLEMTFDAGHRIVGHKGKCARLHGHTYRVEIRCAGPVRDPGFVIDFGDIKDLVNKWDHQMLLWEQDEISNFALQEFGVIDLPFNPTAENMAAYLASEIAEKFDLLEVSVTLWETPKASAFAHVSRGSAGLD